MFPVQAGPTDGPYLHAWPYDYGLEGEGFAPLSSPTHHLITKAALDALPEVRARLGGEAELLTWCYCGLQDMNWPTYGRFNPNEPFPDVRFPDSRREWDISRYCAFNPVTRRGRMRHDGPESCRFHYARACAAAARGRARDAVRLLGVALHALQDAGSPMHAARVHEAPFHAAGERPDEHPGLENVRHRPKPGFEPGAAAEALARYAAPRGERILRRLKADLEADVLDLQMECARACVRRSVDAIADFFGRFGDALSLRGRAPRKGVNLLANPDFSLPDDEPLLPRGWSVKWWDRSERAVEIARNRAGRGLTARNARARVACLTTWPRAVLVEPGQTFRLSGRIAAPAPQCAGLYAAAYDDATRKVMEWEAFVEPSRRPRRAEIVFTVQAGARRLRVGVFAQSTPGPARFFDVSLERVS